MPNQKNNHILLKSSMPAILSLVIVGVVALELAAAYFFWYPSLEPKPVSTDANSIVRVDLPGYRAVIEFLDTLVAFEPDTRAVQADNPFESR